jgi:hypothetical protein
MPQAGVFSSFVQFGAGLWTRSLQTPTILFKTGSDIVNLV